MAVLNVTHTMLAGDYARASDVNRNFQDIVDWAAGGIDVNNLGTLTGTLSWVIGPGADRAIEILNGTSDGDILVTQTAPLSTNECLVKLQLTAATTEAGSPNAAGICMDFSNVGTTIPMIRLENSGSGAYVRFLDGASIERMSIRSDGTFATQLKTTDAGITDFKDVTVDGGPVLSNNAGVLELDSNLKVTSTITATTKLVAGTAEITGSGTTIVVGANLTVPGTISVNAGPTLSNSGARLNVNNGVRADYVTFTNSTSRITSTADRFVSITNDGGTNGRPVAVGMANTGKPVIMGGRVTGAGAILSAGTGGWSVVRDSLGIYTVSFSGLGNAPGVTATPGNSENILAVEPVSTTSFRVVIRAVNVNTSSELPASPHTHGIGPLLVDDAFSFTLIGILP